MKSNFIHGLVSIVFLGVIFSSFVLMSYLNHPEKSIVGTWKEVSWMYEKVDLPKDKDSVMNVFLEDQLKNEITKDLVIHKSETWRFDKNSRLTLLKEGNVKEILKWRLKGRGHILKLKHEGNTLEFYQIKELTNDKLVLHFENDMHARGIVRIEFQKIK
jgi:hypothetical protein